MDLQDIILPVIATDANKYSRGTVAVLAGSARYPGAAVLASLAAARSGSGYVTLFCPQDAVAAAHSHLITVPVVGVSDAGGAFDGNKAAAAVWAELGGISTFANANVGSGNIKNEYQLKPNAVVIGPGMTNAPCAQEFFLAIYNHLCKATNNTAVLIDADGLNNLAILAQAGKITEQPMHGKVVLTPHAGELKRLLDAFGVGSAQALAQLLGAVVVSKGPTTTVTDGERTVGLDAGSPALASAGTGDVLSGIIGALLAQVVCTPTGLPPLQTFETALAGVKIHGAAGREAQRRLGQRSVIATDVVDALPAVFRAIDEGGQF